MLSRILNGPTLNNYYYIDVRNAVFLRYDPRLSRNK